jgi:hypothetical protein
VKNQKNEGKEKKEGLGSHLQAPHQQHAARVHLLLACIAVHDYASSWQSSSPHIKTPLAR